MRKIIAFLIFALMLSFLLVSISGCVKDSEVCNYDGICTHDETDGCADCQNVLGRAIQLPKEYQEPQRSP